MRGEGSKRVMGLKKVRRRKRTRRVREVSAGEKVRVRGFRKGQRGLVGQGYVGAQGVRRKIEKVG